MFLLLHISPPDAPQRRTQFGFAFFSINFRFDYLTDLAEFWIIQDFHFAFYTVAAMKCCKKQKNNENHQGHAFFCLGAFVLIKLTINVLNMLANIPKISSFQKWISFMENNNEIFQLSFARGCACYFLDKVWTRVFPPFSNFLNYTLDLFFKRQLEHLLWLLTDPLIG